MNETSAPPSSFKHSASLSPSNATPRPLHLTLGTVTGGSSPSTPRSSGSPGASSRTELTSPSVVVEASPTISNLKTTSKAKKRSSITYIPSNGGHDHSPLTSTFDQQGSNEVLRSPLGLGVDVKWNSGAGLSRSSSLGGGGGGRGSSSRGAGTPRTTTRFSDSHTSTSAKDATSTTPHVKDRPPVTLAEKHAELLHFIAQKESKCLELRSQLAVHEAELLELKRKWERIVNRGFGKSLSPGDTNTHSTSPNGSLLLASSPSPSSSQSHTTPNFPLSGVLSPTATTPGAAVVFEGIKEGVQGVSRLIAAGLESIVQVNAADGTSDKTPEQSNPIPFRLGSAPQKQHQRKANGHIYGHGQNESQSSSSTAVSAISSGAFSSVSLSSASSVDTLASGSDSTAKLPSSTSSEDAQSEFGEFESGQASRVSSTRSSLSGKDILMVQDTGATPTMSPNPDFQRRREKKMNLKEVSELKLDPVDTEVFDWDDGWDEPASEEQAKDDALKTASSSSSRSAVGAPSGKEGKAKSNPASSPSTAFVPLSSIVATPQMSSWVGSVGKKWGELKGGNTFTRSQKRASVLLSDMQQSIVSVLTSPSATNSETNTSSSLTSNSATSPSPLSPTSKSLFSSNASSRNEKLKGKAQTQQPQSHRSMTISPQPSPDQAQAQASSTSTSSTSLLDDSDGEEDARPNGSGGGDEDDTVRMRMNVMLPDSVSPTTPVLTPKNTKEADDDEWNW
ncbi:hypothetical protein D9613_008804 [Agrocybe pediades]|uniref:Uncharacterized protein n=1 Tax=Agrocybe pediades TaxID=84607 RepID=A0A8H4QT49_9AGAR|nr:hypothetical protein D9613_008804 [Agrocybe pediades]